MLLLRYVLVFIAVASLSPTASSFTTCNETELLAILTPLKSNANYAGCSIDHHTPCNNTACKALIAPIAALDLPSCVWKYNPVVLKRWTVDQCDPNTKDAYKRFLIGAFRRVLKFLKRH